ncbi:MAG: hypothetical protein ACI9U2_001034 [Bradymonadia bacterium]|jgi:hypothetical protein
MIRTLPATATSAALSIAAVARRRVERVAARCALARCAVDGHGLAGAIDGIEQRGDQPFEDRHVGSGVVVLGSVGLSI